MAPTASPKPVGAVASDSSSEEETSSSGDEQQVEQRPAKSPIRAPVWDDDESESSEEDDDEIQADGSSDAPAKRGAPPPLPPHLQGTEDDEGSDCYDSDSDEAVSEAQTLPKGNVPSADLAKPSTLKRTAAMAELATPPSKKKKEAPTPKPAKSPHPEKPAAAAAGEDGTKAPRMVTPAKVIPKLPEKTVAANKVAKAQHRATTSAGKEVAELLPPNKAAAAVAGSEAATPLLLNKAAAAAAVVSQDAIKIMQCCLRQTRMLLIYNADKHYLEEKSDTYCHLAQEVKALETESNSPGMFNTVFLNIAHDKATLLNDKIKKQKLAEMNVLSNRCDIKKEVITTISKLME